MNNNTMVTNQMIKAKNMHIINIRSIAGSQVYEKGNVYCAPKPAVDGCIQSHTRRFFEENPLI